VRQSQTHRHCEEHKRRGNLGFNHNSRFAFVYSIIFFVGRTCSTLGRIRDFTRFGRAENNSLALRQILGRSLCSPSGLPLVSSGRPQVSLCPTVTEAFALCSKL